MIRGQEVVAGRDPLPARPASVPSYAPARACEQCGASMSPYLPRRRHQETGRLLCPGCEGFAKKGGQPVDHLVLARRLWEAQESIERVVRRDSLGYRLAHDSGDGETIYHCPFCGAGQVVGGADGTISCQFCHTTFTVQAQPEFAAMPQTVDGVPYPIPGMPNDKTGPGGPAPDEPSPFEPEGGPGVPGDSGLGAADEPTKKGPVPPQFQKKTSLTTLPTSSLDFYDPPAGLGDEGWDLAVLRESIRQNGITEPLEVGRSAAEVARGNRQVYVFNGAHRLLMARELGLPVVPVVQSTAEDAVGYQGETTALYVTAQGVALPEDAYLRHLALAHADDRDVVLARVRAETRG